MRQKLTKLTSKCKRGRERQHTKKIISEYSGGVGNILTQKSCEPHVACPSSTIGVWDTRMKMEPGNGKPGDIPQKYFILKVQQILMFLEPSLLYFFKVILIVFLKFIIIAGCYLKMLFSGLYHHASVRQYTTFQTGYNFFLYQMF